MRIIHFKKFCVPVSTGTTKGDKLLKIPSDLISDGVIFQTFLGGMPPDPLVLACFTCLCASHTMRVHIPAGPCMNINNDDRAGCAPFSKV